MAHGQSSIGVMFNTDRMSGRALQDFAAEIETIGVSTLWLPELFGREPFSTAGYVLASTNELRVATGIANVYARDAVADAAGARRERRRHRNEGKPAGGGVNAGVRSERQIVLCK